MNASSPDLSFTFLAHLEQGCESLGLVMSDDQLARLSEYLLLLSRWNKAYNLTAVRDEQQMVVRHLLDSLVVAQYLRESRVLDVGTGAGLPGVPLAIAYPEREFHLLDSNGKKTRFLFQVKTALGLDNMMIHQARVESFGAEQSFEVILSRAFASLEDMICGCRHLLSPGGRFLAMKGGYPQKEIDALAPLDLNIVVTPVQVPGLPEQRHLVEIRQ